MEKPNARQVIRAQEEVIRAQNVLIDWLLEKIEKERSKRQDRSTCSERNTG
jgi:hypothetical protein